MHVFVQLVSGQVHSVSVWNGYDMKDFLDNVSTILYDVYAIDVPSSRVVFYDSNYEKIEYDEDDYVTPGATYHVMVLDEEDGKDVNDDSHSRAE